MISVVIISPLTSGRSTSEKGGVKAKRMSTGSSHNTSGASTAEEFFIDVILARHARKLLTAGHLTKLGVFFAQFPDFQAVTWLRKEKDRAGQVQDFVWAVEKIHEDFCWPWPVESRPESCPSEAGSSRLVEDNLRQLYINTGPGGGRQTDSGYLSHQTIRPDRQSQSSLLTVEAMLRIKEGHGHIGSIASDEGDLGSVSGVQSPVAATPRDTGSEIGTVSRAEAQLTFLLHLLLEAECLDWASCVAVVLRDVMAIIRIISSARAGSEETGARLQVGVSALAEELPQYSQFLAAVRPHMTGLTSPPASVSPAQPQLARSMSDPGTEREADLQRREAEREEEKPRAATPSPGLNLVKQETEVRQPQQEEEEEEDTGCRLM